MHATPTYDNVSSHLVWLQKFNSTKDITAKSIFLRSWRLTVTWLEGSGLVFLHDPPAHDDAPQYKVNCLQMVHQFTRYYLGEERRKASDTHTAGWMDRLSDSKIPFLPQLDHSGGDIHTTNSLELVSALLPYWNWLLGKTIFSAAHLGFCTLAGTGRPVQKAKWAATGDQCVDSNRLHSGWHWQATVEKASGLLQLINAQTAPDCTLAGTGRLL